MVRAEQQLEPRPLTSAQAEVVAAASGSARAICVVGGPGTGKTTTAVAAVVAQVQVGVPLSRLVVLTGSRSAAQHLRARIVAALGRTQRGLQVTTVHGWCQQLLHRFEDPEHPMPRLLSAPEQEFRVRELLVGRGPQSWPESLRPALGTRGFAREVRAILARARQLGLDPADVAAAGRAAERPEWVAVAEFFNEYLDVLDAEGVIDYAELVHRARLLLTDEQAFAALPGFAGTIFIDEFEELDRGMIHLLADANRAGSKVVAFADPDTSVYGFRGADPRAVVDFTDRFNDARLLRLTDNLRSRAGVDAALASVAARLPYRGVDHRPVLALADASGLVSVQIAADDATQVQRVAELLRQAHLRDHIGWSEFAVLTRAGDKAVSTLARRLSAAGVPVQVAGDEVALVDELAVRHLLSVLNAATRLAEGQGPDERQAARLLRTPLGGLDAVGLRRLGRELRSRAVAAEPDQPPAGSGRLIADELTSPVLIPDESDTCPEAATLARFRRLLAELGRLVEQRADLPTILWHAWSQTGWPRALQAEALRGGEGAPRAHRDLDAVVALFDMAAREGSWAGAKGVRALVAEVEGQQIPADTSRENDPRRNGVTVATVHRAKGEQWRLVVLVGLQEGQWPALNEPGGLLRADLLGADGLQAPTTLTERLAAERRALLLAASRASEELVVLGVEDPTGEADPPSRFLREFGVTPELVTGQQLPSTLPGLVAMLRRSVVDTGLSPQLRDRAAAELAWLAEQTDDQGRPLAPGAHPDTWWGLREFTTADRPVASAGRPIRIRGSELADLLGCPRKWFLSRRARATRSWGPAAAFGTLVHRLMEEATRTRKPAAELLHRLDEVWPRLPYEADWLGLAEQQAAGEALRRFDAWASSPDHQQVVGVEVPFEVPLQVDGHELVLVGTVDRLEVDHRDRLRVVDFKTSRSAVSTEEAAVMDQLGVYQLAARMGAFDELAAGRRGVADAEVVYLRCGDGQPTVRTQLSLDARPDDRTWVHDRLSQAAAIITTERFDARADKACGRCDFRQGCPLQLAGGEEW